MAIGISPKHVQEYYPDSEEEAFFLVFAIEAAHQLGWDVSFVSETGFTAYTKFSWNSWSEELTVSFANGMATLRSQCTGNQLIDWGKNKKNVEALLSKIADLKSSLTPEEIESKQAAFREMYPAVEEGQLNRPSSTAKENMTGFFSIFKPTEGYFITPVLININLLIFILMLLSGVHLFLPGNQELVNWGANFRPVTLAGQWWRLLTACFLHIGVLHLLLNMYALLYIGLLLEPYLGKTRFLAAYLLSGIAGSVASLAWNDLTISAGASGAIFGLYGVFLALLTTNLLDKSTKKALLASIAVFVGYNLLNGLKAGSGIDNAAHIGGLAAGLVIGYAYVPGLRQYENKTIRFSTIGALTLVLLISSFTVYQKLPKDIAKYDSTMQSFAATEALALQVYNLPEGSSDAEILTALKDKGVYYWNKNLKLIEGLDALDLPQTLKSRNEKLREYCNLRIKSYELLYKSIAENTQQYESEMIQYNQGIEKLIGELTGGK